MLRRPAHLLTALLLLALMAMQLVQVASFEVRRMVLRQEIKQRIHLGLPEDELVRFAFTRTAYEALEKEDGGREFRIDGHLYDVVRSTVDADGTVHVEAVNDRAEARLIAHLGTLLGAGMKQRGMGREQARLLTSVLPMAMPEPIMDRAWALQDGVGLERSLVTVLCRGGLRELLRPPRA